MYDHRWWLKCGKSNREVSFIYKHNAAGAAAARCAPITVFLFCYVDTVCGFATDYLDLIDYNYNAICCCTTYKQIFVYTCLLLCIVLLYCCCCSGAACCRCLSPCAGWQKLLPWFIASDSSVFAFSSFEHDVFSMNPLAVLSHFPHRFFFFFFSPSHLLSSPFYSLS